ncbi:hypothetical protein BDV3_004292 [Batrachochytrium dendrobatidis]|uniref:oxaloacetate tautomerase n=1 Tax=Batrachochytrium dendrobatidis (strain JEL423) TaxID=403673 RepID=A0A177WGD6_BATDL|nr:hypothetical protein O5D80_008068 [Batrachochytrium dendrobatidis]KAK5673016.1 hypothetical protein QVD99_000490 [Batrachochytrium dendrobatidis]OAJ38846.1 hypothetical protein BDEG_22745 [Batrachochytrium dendrobatidis JEL423]
MSARSFVQTGRKIVAIGRNYAQHAKELGNAVPDKPMFFIKPTSSYLQSPGSIEIPHNTVVHHEIELGVVIGKDGRDIPETAAESYIAGYCLALDMTARNLQDDAKKKGYPWTVAKGYDTFTPVGDFIPVSNVKDHSNLNLSLKVDGHVKQNGTTKDMIFRIPKLISHVSTVMRLEKGDVILTGTPEGVGPIAPGNVLEGLLEDPTTKKPISSITFSVVSRSKPPPGVDQ